MNYPDTKYLIDSFYKQYPAFEECDDPTTTLISAGAVLLASAALDSICAGTLARLTRLPIEFVSLVAESLDYQDESFEHNWTCLEQDLTAVPLNFAEVALSMDAVLDQFWSNKHLPNLDIALELCRDRRLIGGERQWWIDRENLPSFLAPPSVYVN